MAQLVERVLGKDEVISSTLISSSKLGRQSPAELFCFCAKAQKHVKQNCSQLYNQSTKDAKVGKNG